MKLSDRKFPILSVSVLLAAGALLLPGLASQERARLRSQVDLVNVLVSVTDEHHRPVANLRREQFSILEEGREQKIEIFEPETQLPLDLALMIDSSLSTQKEMLAEREAASGFIRQVLRPGDGLSVFEFDESVRQITGFSDDATYLQQSLAKLTPGAGTSLYDAIVRGSEALEIRAEERRRVIVLVTDAGETTSHYDFDEARRTALEAGALLYTIVVRPAPGESGRNTAGEHALEAITETTGGAIFIPERPQELPGIFGTIDQELRTQYRLGYYPAPRGKAGSFRTIEVKVPENYEARHRKGYFAAPD